jgi:predicted pyridoxine 5'-phosphate oxidase superfamily flavin-nucleotide-binding protein
MQTKYQDTFGYPVPRTAGKVMPNMVPWIQDFIRRSPFCVMATSNGNGDCDASPKGGTPGCVKVSNDKQLFIPDVAEQALRDAAIVLLHLPDHASPEPLPRSPR